MLYRDVMKKLVRDGRVALTDSVLVVCGDDFDRRVLTAVGFDNLTVTNLDAGQNQQDAERLTYSDGSFDIVAVHAGLHHCHSPHRALLEMYRVARKMVVVFEARDSITMRAARLLRMTSDYEINAVTSHHYIDGGVRNTAIPNFIYRWTEREVMKTVRSYDPTTIPDVEFFYGFRMPDHLSAPAQWVVGAVARIVTAVAPRQGNAFGFAIRKSARLQPWLARSGDEVAMRRITRSQSHL